MTTACRVKFGCRVRLLTSVRVETLPRVGVALYFHRCPNSGLEYLSEEKSKRLDGRGSEAASFARQGEAIRDRNRKTAASHARFSRSEGTDPAGAFPVHPAPTSLERGYSRDRTIDAIKFGRPTLTAHGSLTSIRVYPMDPQMSRKFLSPFPKSRLVRAGRLHKPVIRIQGQYGKCLIRLSE